MSLVEATAVEHFAHALAEPPAEAFLLDIETRTERMNRVVDEVVKHFSPTPRMSAAQRAKNLKVVDGLAALMGSHIDDQAANIEARRREGHPAMIEAAIEVHDDTVRQYYRLIALRSDLDPECRPTGEILSTPQEIAAYFARISAEADAQA